MKSVLFVCLGNICRSPAAEAVFSYYLKSINKENDIYVDSAGTSGHHEGEKSESRMIETASNRGYKMLSRARQFDPHSDFERFDRIITMDQSNYTNICSLSNNKLYLTKIKPAVSYLRNFKIKEIPDPYYGGQNGFDFVLDLLEDMVEPIYADLVSEIK